MKVNHNMTAIRTNLNLNRTNTNLDNVTYKLSSGYKINNAKDDPAGYAILKRLNRQIKGLDQANRNSADAISAINTAEGALQEIHSILQRMSELATQGANDTNVTADRHALKLELTALSSEITRIANTTEFNTMKLLSGTFTGKNLQVGANYMQHISIRISGMTASRLNVQNENLNISNYEVATGTISIIHAAINKVSDQRSQLGALQNRLEHTINNLSNVAENLQAAESQIRDTDMATTMVEYSKNNIIQQAAQSMLSQDRKSVV